MARYFQGYAESLGLDMDRFLAMGRFDDSAWDNFNMAVLAGRGSGFINGVSRLHGVVSRRIFMPAFPRWPVHEIPVGHVTNGVHVPTWDSEFADELWTGVCGKGCWGSDTEGLSAKIGTSSDQELWDIHGHGRQQLIQYVRERMVLMLRQYGFEPSLAARAQTFLDPSILTLGFARRFAAYKRPNLILSDPARLTRLLLDSQRPVQLLVAGKAHPADEEGKRLVQQFVSFARQPEVRARVAFIPDYDIALAQRLVQGIDVWINTPRRPWEACGTSGMKVLVNGGLNLSTLDGWWAEAYEPAVGWAIGDGEVHDGKEDAADANRLYEVLEKEVIPEFYDRNEVGVPLKWVARMRASLSRLTPRFSSNRMLREYVEGYYLPAAESYRDRVSEGGKLARALADWQEGLIANWSKVHFGNVEAVQKDGRWFFEVAVYTGDLRPDDVVVQLCAMEVAGSSPVCQTMKRERQIPGAVNGWFYQADVPASRPADHFTPRVIPSHPSARIPLEDNHILWQK
jgi:starch phosphorylase